MGGNNAHPSCQFIFDIKFWVH